MTKKNVLTASAYELLTHSFPYHYCLRVRLNSLQPSLSERSQPEWRYDFLNIITEAILKQSFYSMSFYGLTLLPSILYLFLVFQLSFSYFFFSFVFTFCFFSPLPPFTFSVQIGFFLYIITIRIFHINEMKWQSV